MIKKSSDAGLSISELIQKAKKKHQKLLTKALHEFVLSRKWKVLN